MITFRMLLQLNCYLSNFSVSSVQVANVSSSRVVTNNYIIVSNVIIIKLGNFRTLLQIKCFTFESCNI